MRLDQLPRSDKVEDRRGDGPGGFPMGRAGGVGIGTIILLVLVGWALGINPLYLIGGAEILSGLRGSQEQSQPAAGNDKMEARSDQMSEFVSAVLGSTEVQWKEILAQAGRSYEGPTLACSPAPRARHAGLRSPPWVRSTVRTTRRSISISHSFRISSGVSADAMLEARAANSPRPM